MSKSRKGKAVRGYGFIVTEETKSKMSEAGKNKVFTEEHKQNYFLERSVIYFLSTSSFILKIEIY